jgi:multidrug resistance protein, MATE family
MLGSRVDIAQHSLSSDMRRIAALAAPMLIGQFAFIAFGALDTAMIGRSSPVDLAALALGASINTTVYMGLAPILFSLRPTVGQLLGKAESRQIGARVREAAWLAMVLMIIGALVLRNAAPILRLADASDAVNERALLYMRVLSMALPASLLFELFASLSSSVSKPGHIMVIWLAALVVKVPLNALLIYGGFGVRSFGGPGAAYATTIAMWFAVLVYIAVVRLHPFYSPFRIFERPSRPRWHYQWQFLRLGVPMAFSSLVELTSHTLITLFISRFDTTILAGHQIAANVGAILYMVPFSIGIATSTLVSQVIGAAANVRARSLSRAGISLAVLSALVVSAGTAIAAGAIADAYTSDARVAKVAMSLVQIVAIYHLADAIQVSVAYTLRGYKITIIPAMIYTGALYGIGVLGGYELTFHVSRFALGATTGARVLWWMDTAGLSAAGILLLFYWYRASNASFF